MAITERKRSAFGVQVTPALSTWPLAFSQTNLRINSKASASPRPGSPESPVLAFWGSRLRGENGGRR